MKLSSTELIDPLVSPEGCLQTTEGHEANGAIETVKESKDAIVDSDIAELTVQN